MKKKISRKQRKIFLMLIVVFITAVTLAVETYAWFAGLNTASTGNVTIAISSVDGLELSLNGQYWTSGSDALLIKDSSHTYITETGCSNANCAYSGHKNKWPTALSPVSSAGYTDETTGRLDIYKKKRMTSQTAGYYITSEKIANSINEGEGYVAFDLFIRNGKGSAYNGDTYNANAEEDIYLTPDSFATTVASGSQPDYGAANSLRVGFFEIGRVKSNGYNVSTLTGITCNSSVSGVTNLCNRNYSNLQNSYVKGIWEPNYASHTTLIVNYFNQNCKRTDDFTPCQHIDSGTYKRTYSIYENIDLNGGVPIYSGNDVMGYYSADSDFYLRFVQTYKTSDATAVGHDKNSFIRLAGNSITKVRVYIWLEGQDIDNFDIISKNPSVQVKFGLTKDRNAKDTTNTRSSSFADDSWETIQYNIQHNNTSQYHVGDMRTVSVDGDELRMRIANMSSSDSVCSGSTNSQTACGFVVEFMSTITLQEKMMNTGTNVGGYPASIIYSLLNGEAYDSLPSDLKSVITTTRVVSGHGSGNSNDFTSNNQKLYLLSAKEVFGIDTYDTAASKTRQLDYYRDRNVLYDFGTNTGTNFDRVIKMAEPNSISIPYWLRTAKSDDNTHFMYVSTYEERLSANFESTASGGVAPAFRIA